ncbi:MAG TPA: hypothetical protein VGD67_10105 [Pseudonocardiaceae bacterium]
MRRLRLLVRARVDYAVYLGAREWPLMLSGLGVILGLATVVPTAVGVVLSLVALAAGTTVLVRDARHFRRRWSAYDFTGIAAPFPVHEVPPPAAYPDARYVVVPGRGSGLVSDVVDATLDAGGLRVLLGDEAYRLPARLRATAPYVLRARHRGRLLFNGPVIGMRDDPLVRPGGDPSVVRLHRARFFDGQCSNELCTVRIRHRETGRVHDVRRTDLVSTSGVLRSLSESELADLVGVSTMALTVDGRFVVVRQSDRNSASPLLLAPSGSGSLEPRDLAPPAGGGAPPLRDVLVRGMERELCEETGIAAGDVVRTRVVGFARWMERGAKPEFFGLTELSVTASALRFAPLGSDERVYSSGVFTVPVDLAAVGADLGRGIALERLPSLPEELREDGSLPLLLAIRAAATWARERAAVDGGTA